MDSELYKNLLSLHNKIDGVATTQKEMKDQIANMPCGVNNNRLQNLEKVVYGAMKVVLVAFVVGVVALVFRSEGAKGVAEAKVKDTKAVMGRQAK